ncbi:MAG: ABC transporter ATP-binding protein [Chloroflexi bacterium]|nr:ABC transporter ATP-binding protein [Chloroflexota bacterium]
MTDPVHDATGAPPTPDDAPLLAVRSVSRSFGDVRALVDVSLDIRQNEFFALLGPSGCGKTTLLRILAGFEHPDTGSVTLGGADLLALPPERRPVNLMFQSYALFPHMSVERNVAYGLEREGLPKDEVQARVAEVLRVVGISETARRRPSQLSGGQRQRVALARAIVKRPRLLLLDEPLSALDRKVRGEMQLELKRLQHEVGITFVVVTHDQEEAMSMADRIAVFQRGRIEQVDRPVMLYERPRSLFVARFIGNNDLFPGTIAPGGLEVAGLGVLPTAESELAVGTAAWLGIRPEHIALVGEGAPRILTGEVIETQFLGGASTIAVGVSGYETPVLVTQAGATRLERGATVGLTWDPARAVVLPSE